MTLVAGTILLSLFAAFASTLTSQPWGGSHDDGPDCVSARGGRR